MFVKKIIASLFNKRWLSTFKAFNKFTVLLLTFFILMTINVFAAHSSDSNLITPIFQACEVLKEYTLTVTNTGGLLADPIYNVRIYNGTLPPQLGQSDQKDFSCGPAPSGWLFKGLFIIGSESYCEYETIKDPSHPDTIGPGEALNFTFSINITKESVHQFRVSTIDTQTPVGFQYFSFPTVTIDCTPPETTKNFDGPFKEENGVEWIDGVTEIALNPEDQLPHPSGVDKTWYRNVLQKSEEPCWNPQQACLPSEIEYPGACIDGVQESCLNAGPKDSPEWVECVQNGAANECQFSGWTLYTGQFKKEEESCHKLEFFSVDNVRNVEDVNTNCFFVDKTPPKGEKIIGEPSIDETDEEEVGGGIVSWTFSEQHSGTSAAKLYVLDGTQDWAGIDIPVDIALQDINSLSFWELIKSYNPNGYSVNVILGVDTDGDGVFESDIDAWHVPNPGHNPAVLGDDVFIEMDGVSANPTTGVWTNTDAYNTAQWWTTNTNKDGLSSDCYETLPNIFSGGCVDKPANLNPTDHVKLIKLEIGGSSSWNDETALVDELSLNGNLILDDLNADRFTSLTSDTDITFTCIDQEPHPSGDEVIWFRYRVDEGQGFGPWLPADSSSCDQLDGVLDGDLLKDGWCDSVIIGATKTINFPESSLHELQWYCEDAVEKRSETDVEFFKVDNDDPVITKTMIGEDHVGDCPPDPNSETDVCYVADNGLNGVHVEASDGNSIHAVDQVTCSYELWWETTLDTCINELGPEHLYNSETGQCFVEGNSFEEGGADVIFTEDSNHELIVNCQDALGNAVKDVETFQVDSTPPTTTKTYGEPFYACNPQIQTCGGVDAYGGVYPRWINSSTPITLNAIDAKVGVDKTYWRYKVIDDRWCQTPATGCIEYNGPMDVTFEEYAGPVILPEESCHIIEYYSTDLLGNTEETHRQCAFVDNTPPDWTKEIGEPRVGDIVSFSTSGTGTSGLTDNGAHLFAPLITSFPPSNEGRIRIPLGGMTLNDIDTLSWDANVIQGYLPHVDVFLGNGKTLTFEYAKASNVNCDNAPYPTGILNTFSDKGIVDNNAYAWTDIPGPCGDATFDAQHNSLAEWKTVYGTESVLALEIEVDGWIATSESYISNVMLNGEKILLAPYVTIKTPIYLSCTDPLPHPVDQSTIYWRFSLWQDGFSGQPQYSDWFSAEGKATVYFEQDSWHDLEFYCQDALGNVGETDLEFFIVDTVPPEITKTIEGPHFGDCDPADTNSLDGECIIDGITTIEVEVTDPEPHPVDDVSCYWWYYVNDGETRTRFPVSGVYWTFPINFPQESEHELHIKCKDALDNEFEDVEIFIVDKTPPLTTKEYGDPFVERFGAEYINSNTLITLSATDAVGPHDSGVKETKYRVTLVEDTYCDGTSQIDEVDCDDAVGSGYFLTYTNPFNIPEESCHLIEFYSFDNVDKKEETKRQCAFVDNTAPVFLKEVDDPKHACEEEENCDWFITQNTEIRLSCFDIGEHPVDATSILWKDYLESEQEPQYWNEDGSGVTIYKETDSRHILKAQCFDALGNHNELQDIFEIDVVETVPPISRKLLGDPKVECDENTFEQYGEPQDGCSYITQDTPITLTCNDPTPHPVDHVKIFYKDYLWGTDNLEKLGDATAEWTTEEASSGSSSAKLHVPDTTGNDFAGVDSFFDVFVELEDITDISYDRKVSSFGSTGWSPLIVLGIDADEDGIFEAQPLEWQESGFNPALLGDDSFIQCEATGELSGVDANFINVDAYNNFKCYTPTVTGDGYDWDVYEPLSYFQSNDVGRVKTTDKVVMVKVEIGGSSNFDNEVAYVDNVVLNNNVIIDEPPVDYTEVDDDEVTIFKSEDSVHVLEWYCEDALGNTERTHYEIDIVDTQAPVTEKEVGDPKILLDPECNPEEEICDYFITQNTEITLSCADQLPHPVNDVTLFWRDYLEGQPAPAFTENADGYVVIKKTEDSRHILEWYCVDALGNTEAQQQELDIVETVPPDTTKTYVGPLYTKEVCYEGEGNGESYGEECFTQEFIDTKTTIRLDAVDPDPHPSGLDATYYRVTLAPNEYCAEPEEYCQSCEGTSEECESFQTYEDEFGIEDQSCHIIEFYSVDNLENQEEVEFQCAFVDKTPPVTEKTYEGQLFEEGSSEWINTQTDVVLSAYDPEPHPSGVKETKYKVSLVADTYCDGVNQETQDTLDCDDAPSSESEFLTYDDPFNIPQQSCHLIEFYSVDNVDKTESIKRQCAFVDNTPPTPLKTVSEPKSIWNGADALFYEIADKCWNGQLNQIDCWKVALTTPINLSCVDPQPHPSDHERVCFNIELDGKDTTEEYCELYGEFNESGDGFCCAPNEINDFRFQEETEHNLEFYCEDAVGNKGPVDEEKFKVEGGSFNIDLFKKWNLISVPFMLLNDSPAEVFGDLPGVTGVWTYDSEAGEWLMWAPNKPSDLEQIVPGWGYWVLEKNDSETLTIGGSLFKQGPILPPARQLVPGWNLVGYYGTQWQEFGQDAMFSCGDQEENPFDQVFGSDVYCSLNSLVTTSGFPRWSSLWGFSNCGNDDTSWVGLNACVQDLNRMYAGRGYWIELDVPDIYSPASTCVWNDDNFCVGSD